MHPRALRSRAAGARLAAAGLAVATRRRRERQDQGEEEGPTPGHARELFMMSRTKKEAPVP